MGSDRPSNYEWNYLYPCPNCNREEGVRTMCAGIGSTCGHEGCLHPECMGGTKTCPECGNEPTKKREFRWKREEEY